MENRLIHLYPAVPGGVADYVDACVRHHPGSEKIALDEDAASGVTLSGNCLLHFSGYGYAQRGAPLWLLHKLESERANIDTLGIYFHELYATGAPWSSAFWLSPVQRHIVRRMAEMADFWMTNRAGSAHWLCRFAADKPHAVLPICSNVGEMPAFSSNRAPKIVVFGGAVLRRDTYRAAGDALFAWASLQGMAVHDVGPPISDPIIESSLTRAGVIMHGRLAAAEVSRLLADAAFGVVVYPVGFVAKSGVFAAYCAHGVCPILISESKAASDGLVAGRHYLTGSIFNGGCQFAAAEIGCAAWEWYQSHSVAMHALTQQRLFDCGKT